MIGLYYQSNSNWCELCARAFITCKMESVIDKWGPENDVSLVVEGTDAVGIQATPSSPHWSTSNSVAF